MQVILIGVPRTGSGSMGMALTGHMINGNGVMNRNEPASAVRERLGDDVWNNSFKFAFVRNPYDRWKSCIQTTTEEYTFNREQKKWESFINYNPVIFAPMSHYIDEELDFIGRYERIKSDWKKACERAGISLPLGHVNKSPKRTPHLPKVGRLGDSEKEFIRTYYREDFKRFNYAV